MQPPAQRIMSLSISTPIMAAAISRGKSKTGNVPLRRPKSVTASTMSPRCYEKPGMLTPESVTAHKGGYGSHDLTAECWFRGKGARNSHICISSTKTCFLVFKLVNMPEMSEISLPGVPCRRISVPDSLKSGITGPGKLNRATGAQIQHLRGRRHILKENLKPDNKTLPAGIGARGLDVDSAEISEIYVLLMAT